MKRIIAGVELEVSEPKSKCLGHQWIKITDEIKYEHDGHQKVPVRWGCKVMCANCGDRKILWTDGGMEYL